MPKRDSNRTQDGHWRIKNCPKHAIENRIQACDQEIWHRICTSYKSRNVFLNVTYLPKYRKHLHVLISFLLNLRLNPVLASAEKREGVLRLCKLCELIQGCKFCITDLSYEDRHNMSLEAGLIYGLGRRNIIIFGGQPKIKRSQQKVLDERISNLRSVDEVVKYRLTKPETLVGNLLTRWCSSSELRSLVHGMPSPQRKNFSKWHKAMKKRILKGKKLVDKYAKEEKGDYAMVLNRLHALQAVFRATVKKTTSRKRTK